MQMSGPAKSPLGINKNKENVLNTDEVGLLSQRAILHQGFVQANEPLSAPLGSLNINNDENEYLLDTPPFFSSRHIPSKPFETNPEMASLQVELEATRRKLAEYEKRSKTVSQPLKSTPYRSPVTSTTSSSFDYGYGDISPWSDFDSSVSEAPPPPHPTPTEFPASVPPLCLPSSSVPFPLDNTGWNIASRIFRSHSIFDSR